MCYILEQNFCQHDSSSSPCDHTVTGSQQGRVADWTVALDGTDPYGSHWRTGRSRTSSNFVYGHLTVGIENAFWIVDEAAWAPYTAVSNHCQFATQTLGNTKAVFSWSVNFFCVGILLIWSTKWSLFTKFFTQMSCKLRDESNVLINPWLINN